MTQTEVPIDQPRRRTARPALPYKQHDHLAPITPAAGGARDRLAIDTVLELLPTSTWARRHKGTADVGPRRILSWLDTYPGSGWQDRWVTSGADNDLAWIDTLISADDPRIPSSQHSQLMDGVARLLRGRIVFPSYGFLTSYNPATLYPRARAAFRPDLFERFDSRAGQLAGTRRQHNCALVVASKLVLHTGRDLDELTPEHLLAYRAWHFSVFRKSPSGLDLAWSVLAEVADFEEYATLADAVRLGQRTTTELVDAYDVKHRTVREVLIRYLDERRAGLDYNTFLHIIWALVGVFWADIEHHHPGLDTLNLPAEVVDAWKQRLRTVTTNDGGSRPRRERTRILITVRSFYRDLQQWAADDPAWAAWSFPNPIRKNDTAGFIKAKAKTTAAMHQRVRERLPHLPILVDTAERLKTEQAALLAATNAAAVGQTFEHAGRQYRRRALKSLDRRGAYQLLEPPTRIEDLTTGEQIDVGKKEHESFWGWAVIETLRHTGIRVEELLEITHLALVSYRVPATGELVPMLQIVPSKTNEERLLLVSPELANVLAIIITRLRTENGGTIPLTARYDKHERVIGSPLPHLFQHRHGWSWAIPVDRTIQKWLNQILQRTGLRDAAGAPLRCTPHDFRRMFATEAVSGGLPIHIVAKLLGHKTIDTTQAYTAIFDDELVRSYRSYLDARRTLRPEEEYREPSDEEWRDFEQHFEQRKLELGTCGRPYGTPCKHEHACIRCPSLRVDPRARDRIVDIIANLRARIDEARANGWTGEVEGLKVSLNAAAAKLVSLDKMRGRDRDTSGGITELGIPVIISATP
ncbi:tyrosine-type recombinase/integrase [Antrihabitans stalactiti]|uniref:Site-specific integrase n=1 Tax=Antrihabitans stalactiti TaxID=2584121 RepID=A0A848KC17_9NOCA|nr:site-specific integrase [Antrihabitans stalactiti]NMN95851.1 site-specific integrase [Antrihabitans stalactiti]